MQAVINQRAWGMIPASAVRRVGLGPPDAAEAADEEHLLRLRMADALGAGAALSQQCIERGLCRDRGRADEQFEVR